MCSARISTASILHARPRNMWIIDFGVDIRWNEAALYEAPFEYVSEYVKPSGTRTIDRLTRDHGGCMPTQDRDAYALQALTRYIATSMVSKHLLLFVDCSPIVVPANLLIVIARDDDYFFGVLHSKLTNSGRVAWALNCARPKVVSATHPPPPSKPSPSPGRPDRSRWTTRASRPSPRRRASWCNCATRGSIHPARPRPN